MHMEAQDCCQKASSITFPLCSFSLTQNSTAYSTAYLVAEALLLWGSPVSLSPGAGITGGGLPTCHFMWVRGIWTLVVTLLWQVALTTEPSLQIWTHFIIIGTHGNLNRSKDITSLKIALKLFGLLFSSHQKSHLFLWAKLTFGN